MTEGTVQPLVEQSPVVPPLVSPAPINTLVLMGLGFLLTLLVAVPILFFTQVPKKNTVPIVISSTPTPSVAFSAESFLFLPTNTPNPTQMALTPLPAPTTLLKEQYDNPFDSKTQVVNPFGSSSSSSSTINPFDTLAQ